LIFTRNEIVKLGCAVAEVAPANDPKGIIWRALTLGSYPAVGEQPNGPPPPVALEYLTIVAGLNTLKLFGVAS
jgi:hypothetical protein